MQVYPNGFCCYKFREEWTKWINEGKCSINLSRLGELNWRPFEIMATKVPLITNRTQELEELFTEGEHYLGFSSPEELIEKVGFVLENMDTAQAMADRAYKLVMANHTFYHRILQMLE